MTIPPRPRRAVGACPHCHIRDLYKVHRYSFRIVGFTTHNPINPQKLTYNSFKAILPPCLMVGSMNFPQRNPSYPMVSQNPQLFPPKIFHYIPGCLIVDACFCHGFWSYPDLDILAFPNLMLENRSWNQLNIPKFVFDDRNISGEYPAHLLLKSVKLLINGLVCWGES